MIGEVVLTLSVQVVCRGMECTAEDSRETVVDTKGSFDRGY